MSKYFLREGVFTANTELATFFLDLRRNQFFRLTPPIDEGQLTSGWAQEFTISDSGNELVSQLLKTGLLTILQPSALRVEPKPSRLTAKAGVESLEKVHTGMYFRIASIASVFFCMKEANLLANCTIQEIQESLVGKRDVALRKRQSSSGPETSRIAMILSAYEGARCFHWKKRICLRDSICLFLHLLRFGVIPEIVFGVKDEPAAAHCWVEADGRALQESLDAVNSFRPIFVI